MGGPVGGKGLTPSECELGRLFGIGGLGNGSRGGSDGGGLCLSGLAEEALGNSERVQNEV